MHNNITTGGFVSDSAPQVVVSISPKSSVVVLAVVRIELVAASVSELV